MTTTIVLNSIEQLRDRAEAWDDLWSRSNVSLPIVRAELIAQWCEQFADSAQFRAVIVEQGGQLVAGLPLVGKKLGAFIEAASLPGNEWSPCGDFLLDESAETDEILDLVVKALDRLPWKLIWLDAVVIERSNWSLLLEAVQRCDLSADYRERYRVALFDTTGDWEDYRKSWAKNHRRQMTRLTRNLDQVDALTFHFEPQITGEEVASRLSDFFEIEDLSWKGKSGTSILQSHGMADYYLGQANRLAERGHLNLAWIESAGRPIAFEYSWRAKGIYYAFKIGYDPKFSDYSPGQLLTHCVLHHLFEDAANIAMDCLGPVNQATQRWRPNTYGVGRLVIAPNRLLGRTLFYAYKHLWPVVRRLRGTNQESTGQLTPQNTM